MTDWKDDIVVNRIPWGRQQAPGLTLGAEIQYARSITLWHDYLKDGCRGSVPFMGILFIVGNPR